MFVRDYKVGKRRKPGRGPLWIVLGAIAALLGLVGWWFGPRIYYAVTGDAVLRIEQRVARIGTAVHDPQTTLPELLANIEEARRILEIHEQNEPADPALHFNRGLLRFYELVARAPVDGRNLMLLTGRGYLPLQLESDEVAAVSIPRLARETATDMRRALALDPELDGRAAARLALAYGDLLYSGRTDPYLVRVVTELPAEELPDNLLRYRDWLAAGLFALSGQQARLNQLAAELAAADASSPEAGSGDPPDDAGAANAAAQLRLQTDANQRRLILAAGAFQARDYLTALRLARRVKREPDATPLERVEAARLEGEVFLVQRGAYAALPFFQQAFDFAGTEGDSFVEERLKSVQAAIAP